ncbi:chorismate mutase [Methanosarcinales archaeon]|uniref:Chorismate mutase n=1 Tax=Candidatus Syntropharchaeum caldarium TaxID=1838285 RepID=A0A1F2P7M1_9EURY|nr:MAG: chorismate mutase [Candidatus Syntrophoarchaeum caldarius]RLG33922.1 MAG: chorismate mutase [Methanosarcinales archaeon]
MDLSAVREEIRKIDLKIAELIKARTDLAIHVYKAKKEQNFAIVDNKQVEDVLRRAEEFAIANGLNSDAMKRIFEILIEMNTDEQERFLREGIE